MKHAAVTIVKASYRFATWAYGTTRHFPKWLSHRSKL